MLRRTIVVVLVGLGAFLTALPATAACHFAAFESDVTVGEVDGGAELTVVLVGGQPGCAGTVDWRTVPGTATEGDDYEAASGTVSFTEGDDREETISIVVVADEVAEDAETFTVELSNPTGGITGTGEPATVTIAAHEAADGTGDGVEEPADPPTASDAVEDDGSFPFVPIAVAVVVVAGVAALLASRRAGGGS